MCSSAIWYACKQWAFATHILLMSLKQSSGESWAVSYTVTRLACSGVSLSSFLYILYIIWSNDRNPRWPSQNLLFSHSGPKMLGEFDQCLWGLFMKSVFASSVRQSRICHSLKLWQEVFKWKRSTVSTAFLRPFSCLLAAASTKDPVSTTVFKEIHCFQMLQLLKCGTGCLRDHPSLSSSKPHFSLSLAMLLSLQYASVMWIWCLLSSQDKCVYSKCLLFGD